MTNDPEASHPSPAPRPGSALPDVLAVEARLIRYRAPRHRHFPSALPDDVEAVEFLVETDAPIPRRALGPALHVGSAVLTEVTAVDPTHYRFVGFAPGALEPGARIGLGWTDHREPERTTAFRFEGY
ncbi:hypothetical protein ACIBFB_20380 [Nocardiopsis sp. NPDC050513]|uniref:hypothetical protein n=1 Tax=Nocardiopsis sp. NPDC050513 TaxID=3364338 RepID=UPI0037A6968E